VAAQHLIAEYVNELSAEARQADFAAIVVGYDKETRFVWSTHASPALQLEVLMAAGGKPVAILAAHVAGSALIYQLNPFPEFENDASTLDYLAAVGSGMGDLLEARVLALQN